MQYYFGHTVSIFFRTLQNSKTTIIKAKSEIFDSVALVRIVIFLQGGSGPLGARLSRDRKHILNIHVE